MSSSKNKPSKEALALAAASRANRARRNPPERRLASTQARSPESVEARPAEVTISKAALALGKVSRQLWEQRHSPKKRTKVSHSLPPGFVLVQPGKGKKKPRVELRIMRSPSKPEPNGP